MSGSFSTVDSDFWADNYPASSDEIGQDFDYPRPIFSTSPEQLPTPLPDPDPSVICAQPSPIYSPTHNPPPSLDSHIPFDFHDRSLQSDNQSNHYYTRFGPPSTTQPSPIYSSTYNAPPSLTHALFDFRCRPLQADNQSNHYYTRFEPASTTQSYTILNADSSLKGHTPSVVNDPFPAHDTPYYSRDDLTYAQSYYNGSQAFVDRTKAYHAAMGIPYQQIQSFPASVVQSPSTVPPYLPLQPMVCRSPLTQVPPAHQNPQGNHSITSSHYHPVRTSSLPVQSASPQEVVLGTCKWMKEDGTVCEAQIAYATVPEHLATHGIKKMTGNFRLECRWLECRLRGDRKEMNRESIVRHVREKHLGRKRTL
ncbi:hypothetical protein L210DRAFT_2253540 [Boletus edulis BED1]|uniref:Uncharacterized protein n=1 Tax=Boletus edulis BED1 TaxID=1328754 RepID=A0AAD4G6X2_BOLED|nr:hypothetical protein L210DRAFT_2253540 [Boletus edulis BED1]